MNALRRPLVLASLILPLSSFAAGAIAVDDSGDEPAAGYGVVGSDSREAAASEAMAQCRKEKNKQCKVAVRFDSCGAYAWSSKHSGVGHGRSVDAARMMAMNECGTLACKIVVAECQ